jgi:hypothetical protein
MVTLAVGGHIDRTTVTEYLILLSVNEVTVWIDA